MAHLDRLGVRLRDGLASLFSHKRIPVQVVGLGSLFGIHFLEGEIRNYRDLVQKDTATAYNFFLSLLEQGFFLTSNLDFNALSLPMKERHVDELIAATERAVGTTDKGSIMKNVELKQQAIAYQTNKGVVVMSIDTKLQLYLIICCLMFTFHQHVASAQQPEL